MKTAEEILKEVYDCEDMGDLQLHITLNPSLERIVKAMHKYAEQDRWVSVEERLPEKGESVLTYPHYNCLAFGPSDPDEPMGDWRDNCFWNYDRNKDRYVVAKFTHWQPLPAPPKK